MVPLYQRVNDREGDTLNAEMETDAAVALEWVELLDREGGDDSSASEKGSIDLADSYG